MTTSTGHQLLLDISAESVETKHCGHLRLYRLSDTVYSLQYLDRSETVSVDIDCVRLEVKNKLVRFYDENNALLRCFRINDRRHLELLRDAHQRCQETCNLALELSARLRDVYSEGLQQQLSRREDQDLLCDEVFAMQREAATTLSRETSSDQVEPAQGLLAQRTPAVVANPLASAPVSAAEKKINPVKCFYCEETSTAASHLQFFIHPYVPRTFDHKCTIICSVCIENWNEYRQRALDENQLILPGEINEELCALCSDTPETLILCSTCQRSFCRSCLQKTVSDRRVQQNILEQPDWRCFCCAQHVEASPLLTKESWKQWTSKIKELPTTAQPRETINRKVSAQVHGEKKNKPSPKASSPAAVTAAVTAAVPVSTSTVVPRPSNSSDIISSTCTLENESLSRKETASSVTLTNREHSTGKRGRPRKKNVEIPPGPALETTSKQTQPCLLDEVYYFGQYIRSLEESYARFDRVHKSFSSKNNAGGKPKWPSLPTDEVCFLCKDGGDLVECDYCRRGRNPSHRCLKVYHNYCLSFDVGDDNVAWLCPRHFCSCCGSKQLKFMCMFCPVSICSNCPAKYSTKYNSDKFCEVIGPKVGEFNNGEVVAIACESCCNLFEKVHKQEESLANEQFYTKIGPAKSFLEIGSTEKSNCPQQSSQGENHPSNDENEESLHFKKRRSL